MTIVVGAPGAPLTPPRPRAAVRTELAEPGLWHHGGRIVCAAQRETGIPSPHLRGDLAARTAERQRTALGVWLAAVEGPSGSTFVGHGLVSGIGWDHDAWPLVEDAAVRAALGQARLVSLGGLAVLPGFGGQGVAGALVRARLAWVRRRGLVACASVWDDAPASLSLALRHGRVVGRHPVDPLTLVVYDG